MLTLLHAHLIWSFYLSIGHCVFPYDNKATLLQISLLDPRSSSPSPHFLFPIPTNGHLGNKKSCTLPLPLPFFFLEIDSRSGDMRGYYSLFLLFTTYGISMLLCINLFLKKPLYLAHIRERQFCVFL